ncbi:MAG: hypothetical protein Q4P66_06500 [Actinomycetaceae bacterium]|nr:hypothetical protein [Actinomycetaceae bacterium]
MQVKPDEVLCPNGDASQLVAQAPMPTKSTLFWRNFIPYQFIRFAALNLSIVRMVTRGHDWSK